MKFYFLFFLIIISSTSYGQNKNDFNDIYKKTYLQTSHYDFKKALSIADSLYSTSEKPYFKIKSLMLSATLFQEAGDVNKAVDYASKAEEISKNSNDHVQTSEILGFLATQYRKLRLNNQSLLYIQKATEQADDIEDKRVRSNILGLITQERANYEIDGKNYKKAIQLIEKSQKYFKGSQNENLFLASNERLLGDCLFHLEKYDESLSHYLVGSQLLKSFPDNFLKGFIYNGISAVYIKKQKINEAKKFIDLTQRIADNTQYLELKKEIYKTSQEYYFLLKNLEKLNLSKRKEQDVTEIISKNNNSFINNEQTNLLNKNKDLSKNNVYLIVVSLGVIVIFVVIFSLLSKRNKAGKTKISLLEETLNNMTKTSLDKVKNTSTIRPQVEEKILKRLEVFENSTIFIQKSISLATLSTYCNTNIKYLSIVINSHKQKDFNNYINELRIKFLVNKIKTEPQYLKYKIVSLAELAGFSTQSKFIEAFKKVTSVTPSEFIRNFEVQKTQSKNLNNDNEKYIP